MLGMNRRSMGACAALVLAFVALMAVSSFAQLPTATILGTVKDSTGGAVAGASITVTNVDTGFSRTAPSMDDGSYRFPALPVGHYEVKTTKDGFQTTTRAGITLAVAQDATIDIILQVGSTSQSVVVIGEAPIVDTTSSSAGNLVNEDKITDLPLNGRNWTDLTLMQPGIVRVNILNGNVTTAELNGTIFISNGAATRSNSYLLDGADERTLLGINNTSVTNSSLGVDGIKEYKVVSVLPDATYPLLMGGQTTIVSKGGTNQWHGDAFDFLRNASLDADSYNDPRDTGNVNGCGPDKTLVFPCKRIEPYQRNNFGGAFGGPIRKDKLFFYAVYEGIRSSTGIANTSVTLPLACFVEPNGSPALPGSKTATVPAVIQNNGCVGGSAASPITVNAAVLPLAREFAVPNIVNPQFYPTFNFAFPYTQPLSENYGQIRIDQNISANDSVFFRYTQDNADFTTIRQNIDARSRTNIHGNEIFATLGETHILSPTVLNTARVSFSRTIANLFPFLFNDPHFPVIAIGSNTLFVPGLADNPQQMPGTANPGQITQVTVNGFTSTYGAANAVFSNTGPNIDSQNIYTLSDDIFWTKGKHAFKFGILANRFDGYPYDILGNAGSAAFPGVNGSACPGSNCPLQGYFQGNYTSLSRDIVGANAARQFRWYTMGVYAQDDLKLLSRLTLNLGLRYEFTTVPKEMIPSLAFSLRNPQTDATGTAGGLFANPSLHDVSPRIGFAWDVFGTGKTALRGGAGIYYDIATYGDIMLNNAIAAPTNVPGVFISSSVSYTPATNVAHPPLNSPVATDFATVAANSAPSPRTVDYHIGQPTLLQRNLAIDQQLPWDMGLTVAYVGSRDWHLYQSRDGNPQAFFPTMQPSATAGFGAFANAANPGACTSTGPGNTAANCGTVPTKCPGLGCTAVPVGPNGLPFYCSPADGTAGPPSAAHPCFSNATVIPCVPATVVNGAITSPASCPGKLNPAWNSIQEVKTTGDSYYDSLQISLNKRTSHGLQFQVGYTWSKSLDDGQAQSALENVVNLFQLPLGYCCEVLDKGPSVFNATNNLRANMIYRVPALVKSQGILAKVVNGWGIAPNIAAQTGYPQTPSIGDRVLDNAGSVTDRPDLCPSYNAANLKSTATYTGNRATSTFYNVNLLCLPPAGILGNAPKGFFTGPGLVNTDISITKDTSAKFLGESGDIQFRAELFNAINHPNFAVANLVPFQVSSTTPAAAPAGGAAGTTGISLAPGAGTLATTANTMRQIQVSLKVIF